ncbi:MAG: type II secretion system F family protein [Lachnospiraceae bacterium]
MASFNYKALMPDGKELKSSINAVDLEEAKAMVKAQGGMVLEINEAGALDKEIELPFKLGQKKVSSRDLCVFCRQFVSIIEAGVSIVQALEMLSEQTENKRLAKALQETRDSVEKGDTLSAAFSRNPDVFPGLFISMVEAGEASGSLEVAVSRMAVQFEKDNHIKGLVKKAMMYPIILLCVTVLVVIAILTFVMPTFVDMFETMNIELPFMTKLLINSSNFVINRWYVLIIIVIAIVGAWILFSSNQQGKYIIAKVQLKVPVLSNLVMKTACARFARTLETLLAAGMSMMDSLDICSKTMDNLLYKDALLDVRDNVSLGSSLAGELKRTKLFPPMICHMVGIGEETGNLEQMLESCANYYDEEVENATQQLTAVLEPLIIVVMAVIVLCIVLAIYTPMMSMYDNIG